MDKSKRAIYTAGLKISVIRFAESNGNRAASRHYGIGESNVRFWRKNKQEIEKQSRESRAPGRGRKAAYPELEQQLLDFIHERRKSGCAISTIELRLHAGNLAKEYNPLTNFKASSKWCFNFMKRHDISIRRRTSISQKLPDDHEQKLIEFQRFVIKMRKKHDYADCNIGNADQTPLTFDIPFTQTMAPKAGGVAGEKSITLKSTGNEKNRFTVMVGAYGDGRKMPPYIIFKRKTFPKNINWPDGVIVRNHEKGWMDAALTKDWIKNVWCKEQSEGRRMLVLDAFRCHRMPMVKDILSEDRTDLVIIPDGMTGQLQVMDVSCNRPFKQKMRQKWNEWMFSGVHSFTSSRNTKKPGLDLITQWIKEAWDSIDPSVIRKGFKKCCITNAMDGSEDDVLWNDVTETPREDLDDVDDIQADALYHDNDDVMDDNQMLQFLLDDSDSEFDGFTL